MTTHDPRNEAVRARLAAASPTPALGADDVDRLARSIAARVAQEPPPATGGWRDDIVRLGRVVAPLALAAGLAAVLLIRSGRLQAATETQTETALAGVLAGTTGTSALMQATAPSATWLAIEGE